MLSSYDSLNGHGFMFIKDLSLEDHLNCFVIGIAFFEVTKNHMYNLHYL